MILSRNSITILLTLLPLVGHSQEEPEAKSIKKRSDFVDSTPFVVVNASEPQWTISKYLTGSHFVYAFENDSLYEDTRIQQWMKESNVSTIRWPGGTVVQYYHWDDLNGIPFSNDSWDPEYHEEKQPAHEYMDLDEYITFCRKVDAEPMVGLNIRSGKQFDMLDRSLDEARRLITYCKEKEYGVGYWYIGNEGYAKGFSAEEYAEYIDKYAEVLKSVDPDIKIVVDWKFGPYKKNRFQESVDIAKAANNVDVMEFHEKWGNIWGLKSGHTMDDWRNEFPLYDGKLTVLIQRFREEMRKANKDVKVGFNEWGLGEIEGATAFDYAIVAADFMIEMVKNDVYQACYWNLNMGEPGSRILQTDSSGTQLVQLNPIADVFKLFSGALNKQYLHLDGTDKYVYGFGAKDQETGDIILYLLNKSTHETPVRLGVFGLGTDRSDVKVKLFSAPGAITDYERNNVDINKEEVAIPPSSLCTITISSQQFFLLDLSSAIIYLVTSWVSPILIDNQLSSFSSRFFPLFFVSYRTYMFDSRMFPLPIILPGSPVATPVAMVNESFIWVTCGNSHLQSIRATVAITRHGEGRDESAVSTRLSNRLLTGSVELLGTHYRSCYVNLRRVSIRCKLFSWPGYLEELERKVVQ